MHNFLLEREVSVRDFAGSSLLVLFPFMVVVLIVSLPGGKQPRVNDAGKLVSKGSEKPLAVAKDNNFTSFNRELVSVNLPLGETFLYMIPSGQAKEMGLVSHESNVYVTSNRSSKAGERKITFWGPGSSPHSWEPLLYIQEH